MRDLGETQMVEMYTCILSGPRSSLVACVRKPIPPRSFLLGFVFSLASDEAHHGIRIGGAPEGQRIVGTGRDP